MTFEMNFLPASYRVACERRVALRWSTLLVLVVVGGIFLTEGILRTRIKSLGTTCFHAQQQADAAVARSRQADQLHGRHQASLEQLELWSNQLRPRRSSVVLDNILASLQPSMVLHAIDWKGGALLDEGAAPSLRIVGEMTDLHALSDFITALADTGCVPPLEVRRSGMRTAAPDESLQEFVLESVVSREAMQ